jgi:hypothetical protein
MMAERALRVVHDSMLRGDFDGAIQGAMTVLVEAKIMLNAIKEMKGKTNGNED